MTTDLPYKSHNKRLQPDAASRAADAGVSMIVH